MCVGSGESIWCVRVGTRVVRFRCFRIAAEFARRNGSVVEKC
jgi:hypothetical protein